MFVVSSLILAGLVAAQVFARRAQAQFEGFRHLPKVAPGS